MKSPEALRDVAEFHHTFKLPVVNAPAFPPKERCELRLNLLQEELDELRTAIDDKDLVEVADALADLQYVLSGAILEFGLGDRFKTLFEEVHRSNMSKTCRTLAEAEATVNHYATLGQAGKIEKVGEVYLVYRSGDRKVLKNLAYSPANLRDQLD